jgi:hypothetical protein
VPVVTITGGSGGVCGPNLQPGIFMNATINSTPPTPIAMKKKIRSRFTSVFMKGGLYTRKNPQFFAYFYFFKKYFLIEKNRRKFF